MKNTKRDRALEHPLRRAIYEHLMAKGEPMAIAELAEGLKGQYSQLLYRTRQLVDAGVLRLETRPAKHKAGPIENVYRAVRPA